MEPTDETTGDPTDDPTWKLTDNPIEGISTEPTEKPTRYCSRPSLDRTAEPSNRPSQSPTSSSQTYLQLLYKNSFNRATN